MIHKHPIGRFWGLAVLLSGFYHSVLWASQTQFVRGIDACSSVPAWDGKTQYALILETFDHRDDAQKYRKEIARHCIKQTRLYTSYMASNDTYAVIACPVNNWLRLQQICYEARRCPVSTVNKAHHRSLFNLMGLFPFSGVHNVQRLQARKDMRKARVLSAQTAVYPRHQRMYQQRRVITQPGWNVTHSKDKQYATDSHVYALNKSVDHKRIETHTMFPQNNKPVPYVGIATGPVLNTSGIPTTYAGWLTSLYGGFGIPIKSLYYLGGEVFGGDSANIRTVYRTELSPNPQSGWTYGVDLLGGIFINPTDLLYVRSGVANTYFLTSRDGLPSTTKGGWQIGIGAQSNLYKQFDIRLEYVMTSYGVILPEQLDFNATNTRAKMYSDQITGGIVYRFNL